MRSIFVVVLAILFLLPAASPAADFDGDSRSDVAIFRPSSGLWAVRGITRVYFGGSGDEARPGDYNGDGIADIAIFRESTGLWAVKGITREYFGGSGDMAIQGSGGQRTYDYVVKPGDGDDLVRALESDTYRSVFIPAGTYNVTETINIDHVRQVTGEEMFDTQISFPSGADMYISIEADYCHLEKVRTYRGGYSNPNYYGAFHVTADYVTIRECRSSLSRALGFSYTSSAGYVSFIDCIASSAGHTGFGGPIGGKADARLVNCAARLCTFIGFSDCNNLSSCYVSGNNETHNGFWDCVNLSSCMALNCNDSGFKECRSLASCEVDGSGNGAYGFDHCSNLSACHVESVTTTEYQVCDHYDATSPQGSCD